jgi:hypothetical protein
MLVESLFTVWVNVEEALPLKLELPAYTAVMEYDPAGRVEVINVA